MSEIQTREELNKYDFDMLVNLVIALQHQLEDKEEMTKYQRDEIKDLKQQVKEVNDKMQLLIEQISIANRRRFGRSSEKSEDVEGQITIADIDDAFQIFNQAEGFFDENGELPDDYEEDDYASPPKKKKKASSYPRKIDIDILPHIETRSRLTEEQLKEFFGDEGYKQLPDQIQFSYRFVPGSISIEEKHIEVYAGKVSERVIKADHPRKLLRNSLVSPNMAAAVFTAKFKTGIPLERQEKEFSEMGAHISTQDMSNWIIQTSDRYLALMWDYQKSLLMKCHVIQSDDTPLQVRKDGRPAGSESRMWVYRSGEREKHPIILYEYQKTRQQIHPREFLKDFRGICVTDGYQVYHNIEKEIEGLKIAGCWVHARRGYDEASKDAPKVTDKNIARTALKMIQAIYREDKKLKELDPAERLTGRQTIVKPLVEAYFEWIKEKLKKVDPESKVGKTIKYSINQEKYLKMFLEDPDVPMDNNAAERAIRPFTIGRKNWVMVDTISGAKASAIAYSLVETAKANRLNVYEYFKHLLTEIPKHMDDTDLSFCEDLLPWSDALPPECRKDRYKK